MLVFYVLLLVPAMIQHFTVKGDLNNYERKNKTAMFFFFVILTILVSFRHESVGNDTGNYIKFFKAYSFMEFGQIGSSDLEIGYGYLNKIVSIISNNAHFFLAVAGVIVSTLIYPTYKRLCTDATLTITLFVIMSTFLMMFSGIRQMLAVGIGFIAYEFTRKKKIIPFILCVLLAISFHVSAFMLIFMYPVYHAKITKKWLYAVAPAMVVLFVFNKQLFTILGVFIERYTDYSASITSTGAFTMLFLFAIFAVFAFLIPDESLLDEETIGMRNFLLLSLALQMFAPLHPLAMRMGYYYIIFIPLLLPKIIEFRSERWSQVAVVGRHIMVVFFLVYFFYNAYVSKSNLHVFPYHFFWESL